MNLFMLEFPSICMRALGIQGSVACGMELLTLYRRDKPDLKLSHYHGNFFWADCDYVVTRSKHELQRLDFYNAEDFLLGYGAELEAELCAYNAAACTYGNFLYAFECTRLDYHARLQELVQTFDLPKSYYDPLAFSLPLEQFSNQSKVDEVCRELKKRMQQRREILISG